MVADAGEDIAQPGLGLEAVEFGGADQRVEDRGSVTAGIAAGEEPVLSAQGYGPDGVLGGVVGDLQPAVVDIGRQRIPARSRIADGTGEFALARQQLQLLVEPVGQCRAFWPLPSARLAAGRRFACDRALDIEQRSDLLQRLARDGRAVRLVHVEELAPHVRPAGDLGDVGGLALGALVELGEAGIAVGVQMAREGGKCSRQRSPLRSGV